MKVEFYRHNIGEVEKERVVKALDSIFLTTGDIVYEFEQKLAQYLQVERSVALMSCTAALHLSLLALDIGPGDEVITTPMTFIATANSILHAGATPVFVDVEPETGNLDVNRVEAAITEKTKAIMPVHLYGHMCDMLALRTLANKYNLKIIEDAAHCLEGIRDGFHPGQLGDAACFSFYATKSITCGEGGAVGVNSSDMAEKLRKLALHGMSRSAADRYHGQYKHWDMELLGWKYNLNNIQAAMLTPQLELANDRLAQREKICQKYEAAFKEVEGIDFPKVLAGTKSARHLFTIWVDPQLRDQFMSEIASRGVSVAVNYRAVHLLSYYKETYNFEPGRFPEAERIGNSTITLPLYNRLTDEEVDYVIATVKSVVSKNYSGVS
ncbi:MAG: DegT/DnrJ/EryC1/StrS family aminotransferase [Blastocatellia bacterium]|nr:DegT/DnrJ/EryC1/StrS family aminotransferase [Blastocatellia bacterium]